MHSTAIGAIHKLTADEFVDHTKNTDDLGNVTIW